MFGIYGGRVWRRAQSRATLLARAGDRCSPLLELGDRCSPLLEFPVTRIHPLSAAHPSHTINHGWQVKSQQEGARAPIAATSLLYYTDRLQPMITGVVTTKVVVTTQGGVVTTLARGL